MTTNGTQGTSFPIPNAWNVEISAVEVIAHAVRHDTVSQIIRPEVAAFLPLRRVVLRSVYAADRFVTTLRLKQKLDVSGESDRSDWAFATKFHFLTSINLSLRSVRASFLAELADAQSCQTATPSAARPRGNEVTSTPGSDALDGFLLERRRKTPEALTGAGIQCLDVRGCHLVGAGALTAISRMRNLHTLRLGGADVDCADFASLGQLVHLTVLDLNCCHRVDASCLAHLTQLPALLELDLSCCQKVDTAALGHVSKIRTLQSIRLCGCFGVTPEGIAHLAALSELRTLEVTGCENLDAAALRPVQHVPDIK